LISTHNDNGVLYQLKISGQPANIHCSTNHHLFATLCIIMLMHVGRFQFLQTTPPDSISSTQVCIMVPTSENSSLEVYVTTLSSIKPSVKLIPPITGVPGSAQKTI